MARARTEVEEEGLIGIDGPQVAEELDGPIGQVGAQVVPILDGTVRPDGVVVVVEGGDELVGLASVEAVPAVESPGQGPCRPGRRHVRLVLRREVPLPHGIGGVTVLTQDLG